MLSKFYYVITLVTIFILQPLSSSADTKNNDFLMFLDNLETFSADFKQIDSLGETSIGKIYIKRPNLVRIDYLTPEIQQIYMNSQDLIHYNKTLDEITYLSTDEMPVRFLLEGAKALAKDPYSTIFSKDQATILKIKSTNIDLEAIFSGAPITLSSLITYNNDDRIRMIFYNQQYNKPIDLAIFSFKNPRIYK